MTKVTIIDPQTAGISGDMLLGALIDAGANSETVQRVLDEIPKYYSKCKSVKLNTKEVRKHGFRACKAELNISEDKEETHAQELVGVAEKIAQALRLSEKAASFAVDSIKVLVDVESVLHGVEVERAHLHEVGSSDTLADIFGVAAACDNLGIFDGEIYSTPVAVGGGTVTFSHGTLGTPAPAVLEILRRKNVPILGGPESVELATPTGVAMLVNLASVSVSTYPPLVPEIVGYGAGTRELTKAPNMLRVVIGRDIGHHSGSDTVQVLETNLDDLPGEVLGHALQRVLDSGAKDVWITSAQFKKNRPGHVFHVICDPDNAERIAEIIMEETGTLGVRYQTANRFKSDREVRTVAMEFEGRRFDVRVKLAQDRTGKIVRVKPEFDDIQTIAQTLSTPAREIADRAMEEARKSLKEKRGRA